jgi:hypothetical protein
LISGNPSFDSKAGVPDAAAQTGAVTMVHCIAERMDRLLETTMPLRRPPVAGGGACCPERSGQVGYALKTPHRKLR